MPATFVPRFAAHCAAHPGRAAFVFGDRTYSYGEFGGLVQAIRDRLAAEVPADERRIAIHATQEVWTYAAIVAVLADGRAYVPLNPHAPADRNRGCLAQARIGTILCATRTEAVEALLVGDDAPRRVLETAGTEPAPALAPLPPVDADAIAYILFTSGSTGLPKGVPIHHRNLDAFLDAFVARSDLGFGPDDRFLQMFDLTFDLSVMSYGVPLVVGGACHVVPPGGPGFLGVAKTLTRGQVTVALMVPSVLSFLERYFDEIRLPALRLSLFCGEALPTRLARAWWACAPAARVLNVYGPTEATIFCSSYELGREPSPRDEYNGVVSIGRPMPRTAFRVVDDALHDVPPGEKGELILIGDQVGSGYWESPERTAAAFIALPDGTRGYRSGDVAFARDGEYYYCGRTDHQLKVDGYRVEAGEIEHHARGLPGVRDAAIVGRPDAAGRTVLHLFLLLGDGAPPATLAKDVRAQLAQHLPPYMVPAKVHGRATFPLNANGKVDRKALGASVGD
ncbi:MAG: amino acid adenylation domain-containing protein [Gemmatimonadaceae bacterium]|nr:amino acid adenylation domain-containing protein [Gemmatimonadaceae bacterium]